MSDAVEPRGPSLTGIVLAAVLLAGLAGALFRATHGLMTDFDGPWHLACGRLIVETGTVPRADPFCFSSDGLDWINLNWLAQVVLYRVYAWRGFEGTISLAGLLLVVTLGAVTLAARARGAGAVATLAGLVPLWVTVVAAHSIRPQAATFALVALVALVLERPDPDLRFGWRRAGLVLAALLLWSQLHGGFVFGFALVGLDAAGTCLDARLRGGPLVPRRALLLGGALVVTVLGFVLHPHGLDALVYAVTYPRALGSTLSTITELMPLDPAGSFGRAVVAYAVFSALVLALAPVRPRARDLLLALAFLAMTISIRRAALPLVIVTLPAVAAAATGVLGRVAARPRAAAALAWVEALLTPAVRALPGALLGAAGLWIALVVAGLGRPGTPGQVSAPPFHPIVSPVAAIEALQRLEGPHAKARVFSLYSAGGLLVWALYPERRTFIDGRGDLHARGRAYEDYMLIGTMQPGWKERLDAWGIDLVLLGTAAPPLQALVEQHGWQPLFSDGKFAIIARPPGEGEAEDARPR